MASPYCPPRYVEEHPYKITMRQLRQLDLFQPGQTTAAYFWNGLFKCEVDLRNSPILACSFFAPDGKNIFQIIWLIKREVGRGERWFFREGGTGILCETMYFYGRLISRQTARLSYRSQSETKSQRLVRKAKKLEAAIIGTSQQGPARGRSRVAKLDKLNETTKALRQLQKMLKYEEERKRLR